MTTEAAAGLLHAEIARVSAEIDAFFQPADRTELAMETCFTGTASDPDPRSDRKAKTALKKISARAILKLLQ